MRDVLFPDITQFLVLSAGFYAGTDFVTPDLDVEGRAMNRWGKLKALWLPYRWMFRHGKSSHNIVYGAAVRIAYISIILLGIYYIMFSALPHSVMVSYMYIFIFLTGIILANALHVILDMLF